METDLLSPALGEFPYRYTQDDRFQYRVKIQPVAGQLEFSIRPVDTRLAAMAADRAFYGSPKRLTSTAVDPEETKRRSKLRAKSRIKLLALEAHVDRLGTFTIRLVDSLPMAYDDVLKAWDYFRRMAVRADKNFHYVAVPELQKNGQWHIHAGLCGYQNVNHFRKMWQTALNKVLKRSQSLIHGKDSPGAFNFPPRRYEGSKVNKGKRIARYISKYIGKSLDAEFNRKSHFHTVGIKVTPAQRQWLNAQSRDAALREVLTAWGLIDDMGIPSVSIWNRDSCSAWFTVASDLAQPPPF